MTSVPNPIEPQEAQRFQYVQQTVMPSTSITLYPTGAAALVPAPPTYEVIPNRIFVGGYPQSTTEGELREHFEKFHQVKDVKMIKSLDGASKGYGFVTFETEDQAEEVRALQLEFRNRKLNLGPAIRKVNVTPYTSEFALGSAQLIAPSQLIPASPSPYGYTIQAPNQPVFVFPPTPLEHTPAQSPINQNPYNPMSDNNNGPRTQQPYYPSVYSPSYQYSPATPGNYYPMPYYQQNMNFPRMNSDGTNGGVFQFPDPNVPYNQNQQPYNNSQGNVYSGTDAVNDGFNRYNSPHSNKKSRSSESKDDKSSNNSGRGDKRNWNDSAKAVSENVSPLKNKNQKSRMKLPPATSPLNSKMKTLSLSHPPQSPSPMKDAEK